MIALPSLLKPGTKIEYGVARIVLNERGKLKACDPYGCINIRIPLGDEIYIEPVPAITRPQQLASCLYVEFAEPIAFSGGKIDLWFLAPFELAIIHRDRIVTRISPTKVKFTVVGDIIDGVICRYNKSVAGFSQDEVTNYVEPGLGFVRAEVEGKAATLPGIGFYVAGLPLYKDEKGNIYYPIVEAEVSENTIQNKTTTNPPIKGLVTISRWKRLILLPTSLTQPIPS